MNVVKELLEFAGAMVCAVCLLVALTLKIRGPESPFFFFIKNLAIYYNYETRENPFYLLFNGKLKIYYNIDSPMEIVGDLRILTYALIQINLDSSGNRTVW